MGLKWTEIMLILVVLLLLFGASRLPQLGQSLGSAIRNFKKGFTGDGDEGGKGGGDAPGKLAQGDGQGASQADKAGTKQG